MATIKQFNERLDALKNDIIADIITSSGVADGERFDYGMDWEDIDGCSQYTGYIHRTGSSLYMVDNDSEEQTGSFEEDDSEESFDHAGPDNSSPNHHNRLEQLDADVLIGMLINIRFNKDESNE